jgi:hypothetical protein
MSYTRKYLVYFVAPLVITGALVLPTLYTAAAGLVRSGRWDGHPRYGPTATLFLQVGLAAALRLRVPRADG